jgi:outer membrane lipoprotein carrier protein
MAGLRSALLALILCAPAAAQATALERFQAFLHGTQSARATFEQKVYDRERRLVQASSGSFSFLRPGRFRWRYERPYEQLIVGDGERVWIHDPDLNQVTVRAMAKALGSTPAALLAGSADVERAFEFAEGGSAGGLEWLEAKPRGEDSGFDRIRLGLSAAGVQAMELTDHFGQTTVLRFSALERNAPLAPSEFRFVPPKGADVLGQ